MRINGTKNPIAVTHPEVVSMWCDNPTLQQGRTPYNTGAGCHSRIWLIYPCGHMHDVRLDAESGYNNRTINNNGGAKKNRPFTCKVCRAIEMGYNHSDPLVALELMRNDHRQASKRKGVVTTTENNVTVTHPLIIPFFREDENDTLKGPLESFRSGAHANVFWTCPKCDELFLRSINQMCLNPNCPACVSKETSSLSSRAWLGTFSLRPQMLLEYPVRNPNGRYWRLDAAIPSMMLGFEFHGDLWHGNPDVYPDPDFISSMTNMRAEDLWYRTIAREDALRKMGWKLIIIWESEWNILADKLGYPRRINLDPSRQTT